ncbi:MAG: hypothetical protein A2X82_05215 [Geobacteraceae bacterium GWC2_55_20]|nr:MAG: hypothetical protein A2X82_05215 [Geobacteraceae bacterium GWC2_55_20]OGU25455.1 MAG: hypothetical protein A2X85_11760 [Geobacteraceae bacterium GWF2_54_21]HCE68986.1 hypothetical protein [Geobacter sp.]
MRVLGITTLIVVMLFSVSYASDMEVDSVNGKLQAMNKAKPCDFYKFVPLQKNDFYVTKAALYNKHKVKIEVEGENLDFGGCIDVDGDGMPEAVISDYHSHAGGAPINRNMIYKSNKDKIELLETFVGEFGEDAAFLDLNKDGKTEVITYVTWSNWGDLALRDSPATPEIHCYKNNRFIDCTKQFPQILRAEIESTLKETSEKKEHKNEYNKHPVLKQEYIGFMKGRALKYLALFSRLGQEKKGWEGVQKLFPDSYKWLKDEWNK